MSVLAATNADRMPTGWHVIMHVQDRVAPRPQTRQSHTGNVHFCRSRSPHVRGKTACHVLSVGRVSPPGRDGLALCHPPCRVDVGWMGNPTESLGIPGLKSSAHTEYQALAKYTFSMSPGRSGIKQARFACHQQAAQSMLSASLWRGKHSCYKLFCDDRTCWKGAAKKTRSPSLGPGVPWPAGIMWSGRPERKQEFSSTTDCWNLPIELF